MRLSIDQESYWGRLPRDLRLILLITPGGRSAPGGMAKIVDYELRYWPAASGYRVKVLDTFGPGPRWAMPFFFFASAATLFFYLLRGRVSLVHLNMAERLSVWRKLTLAFIAQQFNVPVAIHLHGAEFVQSYAKSNRLAAFLVRWRMRRCAAVMCLGSTTKEYLLQTLALSPQKVFVVPNGVPDFGAPSTKCEALCRFVFVGALTGRKGIATLIAALGQLQLALSHWEATIIGGGDVEQHRGYAESLGIGRRVNFLGAVDEATVQTQLRLADVCVLPSKSEGLPLAILEAMSFGCAIVATPVGDVEEAVKPNLTGILTPVGDVDALSEALFRLASDKMHCGKLGRGARQHYEANFTIQEHLVLLNSAYDQCAYQRCHREQHKRRG